MLTETWLTNNPSSSQKIAEITPPGYQFLHRPCSSKHGGGVGALVKKPLQTKLYPSKVYQSFEHIDLSVSTRKAHLRLIIVYRPPPSVKNKLTPKQFLEDFTSYLKELVDHTSDVIIVGDFNVHIDVPHDSTACHFIDIIDSMGLTQHVHDPTHKAGHTLDLVITHSKSAMVHGVETTDPGISDHHAIITSLCIQKPPNITKTIQYCKLKLINIDKFISDLSSSSLTSNPSSSLDELILAYNNTLIDFLDKHALLHSKTVTVRPECKWFNDKLTSTKLELCKLE